MSTEPPKPAVCYYVTGHGFGHAVRTAQILKALPDTIRLILRTTVPAQFFHEELPDRDFTCAPAEFDCGCLQSDSVTVRPRETLDRYREIEQANAARLPDEVAFLGREGVRCVVSDIPAFPLRAAHEAGVPGLAVANFTWHDIYQEYVTTPAEAALLDRMAAEYGLATRALITPLSTPGVADPFPDVERVPLVARRGRSLRASFGGKLGILPGQYLEGGPHYALLYLGQWGLDIAWDALAQWSDWVFLTYDLPPRPVPNVVTLTRDAWPYADVAASVDAVVSKAGYGVVTECLANAVPLIYLPRTGFAEHAALAAGMSVWGGGVEIPVADFRAGQWGRSLREALAMRPRRDAYLTGGAQVIAGHIRDSAPDFTLD